MIFSTEFDVLTLAIIAGITISQSLFGVGILLWGTPIFLLLGENFIQTLTLLLPLSLMVSFLQILPRLDKIDKNIFTRFLKYSLPGIFVGLSIILIYSPDIHLVVAVILCASICLKTKLLSLLIHRAESKFDKLFIFIIGLIHGLSNLGGPLLVLRVSLEKFDKETYRTVTASVYLLFAIIQIIIITFKIGYIEISIIYFLFAVLIYFFTNRYIFFKMNEVLYDRTITFLMFLMALFLFTKYFF
jgi:hypothetical protein